MELSEKLIRLGFTKNQATVYSALIELGQCKASAIIKKTDLHRNIVYEALDDLVARKLAFKTSKGGVALFQLSDATTLVSDAEKQMEIAQDISSEINKLRKKSTHEIKLYEGEDGLRSHRKAILHDFAADEDDGNKEILVLGVSEKVVEDFNDIWKKYHQKRSDANISARMLFSSKSKKYADERAALPVTDIKFLPQSFENPTTIDIWKDQVAFTLYDVEPFIVSMKNAALADSFREYFNNIWDQDTSITTGLEEVKDLFFTKLSELKEGDEYVVLGANYGEETKTKLTAWFKEYHTERINNGVKVKLLGYIADQETLKYEMAAGGDPDLKISQLRFLGSEFDSPMQINIYPDSIVLVHWAKDAVAVEIKRNDIRNAMLQYFNALWNQDTKLSTGRESMEQALFSKLDEMKAGDTYYVHGGQYGKKNPDYIYSWYKKFHQERCAREINLEIIGFADVRDRLTKEMRSADPELKYTKLRFLEPEFLTPMFVHIYPDSAHVGIWDYDEAIIMDTQRGASRDILLKHFQSLWKIAKE